MSWSILCVTICCSQSGTWQRCCNLFSPLNLPKLQKQVPTGLCVSWRAYMSSLDDPIFPTKRRANEQLGGGGSHQPFLDISSTPWMIITWDVLHTKQPSPPGWAYIYAEMSSFFNCWHESFCSKDFLGLEQKRFCIRKGSPTWSKWDHGFVDVYLPMITRWPFLIIFWSFTPRKWGKTNPFLKGVFFWWDETTN